MITTKLFAKYFTRGRFEYNLLCLRAWMSVILLYQSTEHMLVGSKLWLSIRMIYLLGVQFKQSK